MPFTFHFPSTGRSPELHRLADWLTEVGEPFEESPTGLALEAIPLRIDRDHTGQPVVHLHVTTDLLLSRLVGLVFDLSMHLGRRRARRVGHRVPGGDVDAHRR